MATTSRMHQITRKIDDKPLVAHRGLVGGLIPANYTAKIACIDCNNGWMSRIEGEMRDVCIRLHLGSEFIPRPDVTALAKHIPSIRKWAAHKTILHLASCSFGLPEEEFDVHLHRGMQYWMKHYYQTKLPKDEEYLLIAPIWTMNDLVGRWNLLYGPISVDLTDPSDFLRMYSHFVPMKKVVFLTTNIREHFDEISSKLTQASNRWCTVSSDGLTKIVWGESLRVHEADEIITVAWKSFFSDPPRIYPFTDGSPDLEFRKL